MKKVIFGLLATVLIATATFVSCKKEQLVSNNGSKIPVKKNREKVGGSISVQFPAGHPSNLCKGQGACVNFTYNWQVVNIHIPCQASGKECTWTIGVGSAFIPDSPAYEQSIEFQIIGYTGQEFLIYDRSISIPGTDLYMNIPAQILKRNNSGNFVATSVSFTTQQIYSNN